MFSDKEIEFRFSRSYGPGRYDPNYEWGGNDYPIGFVRWTEQRNFQAALHAMGQGLIHLEALTTRRVKFMDALGVYQTLTTSANDIGIVLEYPDAPAESSSKTPHWPPIHVPPKPRALKLQTPCTGFVRGYLGAGNFARTMLLPSLKDQIKLGTVVNQTALSANHVKTKFGFERSETDPNEALSAGRQWRGHHQHAPSSACSDGPQRD